MKKWVEILVKFGPMALSFIPGVPAAIIPVVISSMKNAEELIATKNLPQEEQGAAKKKEVLELTQDAITMANAAKPGSVPQPEAVLDAVDKGIDAVVTSVNAIHVNWGPEASSAIAASDG